MLPEWVQGYVGLPYKSRGRDRDGLDCWGLFYLAGREALDLPLPDYEGPAWDDAVSSAGIVKAAATFAKRFQRLKPGEEQIGDGVLFFIGGLPIHIGMVIGRRRFLHIERNMTSTVARYDALEWRFRVEGFYRCLRHE